MEYDETYFRNRVCNKRVSGAFRGVRGISAGAGVMCIRASWPQRGGEIDDIEDADRDS